MVTEDAAIQKFLKETPLPPDLEKLLPAEFRVFCLMLNALKQWVSTEQQATDRYLLGGTARDILRTVTDQCLVTEEKIGVDGELHHPVRDGRPPILLSKAGHSIIEGQISAKKPDGKGILFSEEIKKIKENGNHSWTQLRKGCQDQLGWSVDFSSRGVKGISRSFAKKVHETTGLTYQQILDWLEEHE